ncbi:hypothetical protein JB92DRAFT_2978241 [Gautieria morchelliformis]|nr:hypothetical protein JB92DRAFT_2978241 [Gautieria morchelliformis]
MPRSVCTIWIHLEVCLAIVILPSIEGLLWARVYAMTQHNQVRWVLGALGLLLYMGSLGTGVFSVVRGECIITAQDLGPVHL